MVVGTFETRMALHYQRHASNSKLELAPLKN